MTFTLAENPRIQLNNGQLIPQLGLGVYKVQQDVAVDVVRTAIDLGYRRVDTAALYDNEVEVGAAIRTSGLDREDLFVTTKIWNDRHGFSEATEAIDEALSRLNVDYIDMLLIHWPCPKQNKFVETWSALEKSLETGKIRGIGVSNFHPEHLDRLIAETQVVPALNQVELHPGLSQTEIRRYDADHGIATEAWSPIARGKLNEHPSIQSISAAHQKTPAQVILRWHIQLGNLVIPKSTNPERLTENLDVFDFELNQSEMDAILALENGERIGPDPREFN
jgi:2,5-diketo-D-gluconate reductase A